MYTIYSLTRIYSSILMKITKTKAGKVRVVAGHEWSSSYHLVGPPGPRGGKKTLCGIRYSDLKHNRAIWRSSSTPIYESKWSFTRYFNGSTYACRRCRDIASGKAKVS